MHKRRCVYKIELFPIYSYAISEVITAEKITFCTPITNDIDSSIQGDAIFFEENKTNF